MSHDAFLSAAFRHELLRRRQRQLPEDAGERLPPLPFALVVAALAFDFGFFKLPLDAEIQKVVKGTKLNTMLAYFNQVSFLFMLFASVPYIHIPLKKRWRIWLKSAFATEVLRHDPVSRIKCGV